MGEKKKQKSVSDMTQEELMEFVYCLNKCMVDYGNDIERAMNFSEKQEWDSLKKPYVSYKAKKLIMRQRQIANTRSCK